MGGNSGSSNSKSWGILVRRNRNSQRGGQGQIPGHFSTTAGSLVPYPPHPSVLGPRAPPQPPQHEEGETMQVAPTIINGAELISDIQRNRDEVVTLSTINRIQEEDLINAQAKIQTLTNEVGTIRANYTTLRQQWQNADSFRQKAEHQLGQVQEQYNIYEAKLGEAERRINNRDGRIASLTSERNGLLRSEQSLNQTVKQLEQTKRSLDRELDAERTTIKNLRERLEASARCIHDFEGELERAKNAVQVHAEDVRKAQESAFQLHETAQWMPEPDRDVTRKLTNLHSSMINWCKNYAYKTAVTSDLSDDDQGCVDRILSQITQTPKGEDPYELEDLRLGSYGPTTLLLAALTHAMYNTIFSNPFFFEIGESRSGDSQKSSEVLNRIYMEMCKIDKKGANAWRSQTLRLLAPQAGVANPSQESRKDAPGLGAVAAENFTLDFIRGDARVFLDSGDEISTAERESRLRDIAIRAAEVAYKLWTQKTQLASLGIDDLPKKKGVVRFSSKSEYLEHHPLHNVQLYEDETCLDGKRVVLVVHPAVVAYGDSEGNDYSTQKVWKKAVVWMRTQ